MKPPPPPLDLQSSKPVWAGPTTGVGTCALEQAPPSKGRRPWHYHRGPRRCWPAVAWALKPSVTSRGVLRMSLTLSSLVLCTCKENNKIYLTKHPGAGRGGGWGGPGAALAEPTEPPRRQILRHRLHVGPAACLHTPWCRVTWPPPAPQSPPSSPGLGTNWPLTRGRTGCQGNRCRRAGPSKWLQRSVVTRPLWEGQALRHFKFKRNKNRLTRGKMKCGWEYEAKHPTLSLPYEDKSEEKI